MMQAHAEELRYLEAERDRLQEVVDNPGPLTVRGEPVVDPRTGEPVPDTMAVVKAIGKIVKLSERMWKLMGLTPLIDYPEGFEKWPQEVRDTWLRGYHALYFPWEHLDIPADLRTKAEAKALGMGLNAHDGVILALEEWTTE